MSNLGRREFRCTKCTKSYSQMGRHLNHNKKDHEHEKKQYKCAFCEKTFNVKSNTKRHERAVHMQIKSFQCETCLCTFATKVSLGGHQRSKHGRLKFACACGSHFAYSYNLKGSSEEMQTIRSYTVTEVSMWRMSKHIYYNQSLEMSLPVCPQRQQLHMRAMWTNLQISIVVEETQGENAQRLIVFNLGSSKQSKLYR